MFIILALVGLAICFLGVRMRKVVLAIQGLMFGAMVGALISILMAGGISGFMYYGMNSSQSSSTLIIIVIAAIIFAIISAVFEKMSAVVNCFIAVLALLLLAMSMIGSFTTPFIIIAAIIAIVCAAIAAKYHLIAFVLSFSVTGGLIAAIGFGGIIYNWRDITYLAGSYVSSGQLTVVLLITVVLSVAGFIVQNNYIKQHLQQ